MSKTIEFVHRWGYFGSVWRIVSVIYVRLFSLMYCKLLGVKIGRGTMVMPGAKIRRGLGGNVTLGDNCIIHDGARILAHGGTIRIGHGTSINPNSILYGHGGVTIGKNVLVAAGTVIVSANHNIIANIPIRGQGLTMKGITIGDDVWLGTGVSVLDGAVIEDGCVVGAGAVVPNQRLQAGCIFGGVPARKIGTRPYDLTVQSSQSTTF